MRGYERQEAGVTPAALLEEGFREGWAREHPGEPVPEEVIRLFTAWAAKPAKPYQPEPPRNRAGRPVPVEDEDDDDPFAEHYTPRHERVAPAKVAEMEAAVRDRMAAAAAKHGGPTDPTQAFFAGMNP